MIPQDKEKNYDHILLGLIPEEWQKFTFHSLYKLLLDAYVELRESSSEIAKIKFHHAAENFTHLCKNHPEVKSLDDERLKKIQIQEKEEKLKKLYQKEVFH